MKVKINLHSVYKEKGHGLTPYAIAKKAGVSTNTAEKYLNQDGVISHGVQSSVIALCSYFGVSWRDPAIVEDVEGQQKTLLATA